jgi:hypothetical protein
MPLDDLFEDFNPVIYKKVRGDPTPAVGEGNKYLKFLHDNQITSSGLQHHVFAELPYKFNSYSGVDITAQMLVPGEAKPLVLGDLSTISYSIHRENKPVRMLGSVNPKGWLRGPRTIAGSMIFTNFDKYTFYRLKKFKDPMMSGYYPLADMLPPFDIVVSFANEYGNFSRLRIFGVNIVDEGSTDLVTESTYTFMARGIQPMIDYVPRELYEALQQGEARRGIIPDIFFGVNGDGGGF